MNSEQYGITEDTTAMVAYVATTYKPTTGNILNRAFKSFCFGEPAHQSSAIARQN